MILGAFTRKWLAVILFGVVGVEAAVLLAFGGFAALLAMQALQCAFAAVLMATLRPREIPPGVLFGACLLRTERPTRFPRGPLSPAEALEKDPFCTGRLGPLVGAAGLTNCPHSDQCCPGVQGAHTRPA